MIELWPNHTEPLDVVARYEGDDRVHSDGSPWLLLSMIASLDGAMSVDGVSGGLGAPADREVFLALRGLADAIVVAAGTVRAEDYGPARPTEQTRARRVARGQAPAARMVVVSGSLSISPDSRLFTETAPGGQADLAPIVFTSEAADPARREALSAVADVRTAGDQGVELAAVTRSLRDDGYLVLLAEGGPTLNGQLLADDLVDELCLSVAPVLVGGDAGRIVTAPTASPRGMRLDRVATGDGLLLLRYVRN
jgi:riboflavin biosynthesis pyrimidine reductase